MRTELRLRRRVVLRAYGRYLKADQLWRTSTLKALEWFPGTADAHIALIGNPGSRVRMRYEERKKALHHLEMARLKLSLAKQRVQQRRQQQTADRLLLTYITV